MGWVQTCLMIPDYDFYLQSHQYALIIICNQSLTDCHNMDDPSITGPSTQARFCPAVVSTVQPEQRPIPHPK